MAVSEVHGGADVQKEVDPLFDRKPVLVAETIEGQAFDVFHHEVGFAGRSDAAVEQARDAGMLEVGEDLAFAEKAHAHFLIGQ